MHRVYDAVVIGGGFFGCYLALSLKQQLNSVVILEREGDLLQRASWVNQARVHNGYHYPRSLLTALRSHLNFPRFVAEYSDCIQTDFQNYYAIGKTFSKVNARQFKTFCQRIGAPLTPAPATIQRLFNSNLVEQVFCTQEYVFDGIKLKEILWHRLQAAGIEVKLNTEVIRLLPAEQIQVILQSPEAEVAIAKYVFNCTYSNLNLILQNSGLSTIPLKHELTEMAFVQVPEMLQHWGITLMCGPFFSLMPFPAKGLHSLSHVRYTPHCFWQDTDTISYPTEQLYRRAVRQTHYPFTIRDAARYLPVLQDCHYINSLWEVKTVLPQSETNDSRPILFKHHPDFPNLISVLGGKFDNVYDIPAELQFLKHC